LAWRAWTLGPGARGRSDGRQAVRSAKGLRRTLEDVAPPITTRCERREGAAGRDSPAFTGQQKGDGFLFSPRQSGLAAEGK